jgi:hypothetical protein
MKRVSAFKVSKESIKLEIESSKVGYAVLVHERFEYLVDSLQSLLNANYGNTDIKFFLINDASSDSRIRDFLSDIAQKDKRVKVLNCSKSNSTAGFVINRALHILEQNSSFDIIGWGDPDCIYNSEWFFNTLGSLVYLKKKKHKTLIISGYNSRNQKFHGVKGKIDTPFGEVITKDQMGLVSILMYNEDRSILGRLKETPDDETFLKLRMKELGIPAISTRTSWIEHIGQESSLNPYRETPMARSDSAMELAESGWPKSLSEYRTLGQIEWHLTSEPLSSTEECVSVAIVCSEKDLSCLPTTIRSLRINLQHAIKEIVLVVDNPEVFREFSEECRIIYEKDIVEKNFPYPMNPSMNFDREGWLYQQILKWQVVLELGSEHVIINDADTVFLKPFKWFNQFTDFQYIDEEFHLPYQEAFYRLFGWLPENPYSYVVHAQHIRLSRLTELIDEIERYSGLSWQRAIYCASDLTEGSGYSEYQTYGLWNSEKVRSNQTRGLRNKIILGSKPKPDDLKNLISQYSRDYDSLSYHEWSLPQETEDF